MDDATAQAWRARVEELESRIKQKQAAVEAAELEAAGGIAERDAALEERRKARGLALAAAAAAAVAESEASKAREEVTRLSAEAKELLKKNNDNNHNSVAATAAAETKAAHATALSLCKSAQSQALHLNSALAEQESTGPRGRLLSLSRKLDEVSAVAERELSSLSSLSARERELQSTLEACGLLASEVATAEQRAREVAGRLPGARQVMASKAVERARARARARQVGGWGARAFFQKK